MLTPVSDHRQRRLLVGVLLAVATTTGLIVLQALVRPQTSTGLYFQRWTSESMMQTVSIADLREEPLQSLWHLHIQPPAFDALRAVLARTVGTDDPAVTLRRVDQGLYLTWALIYGLTVFVVFWWLTDLTGILFAAVSSLLFSAHPALIFYATLLETTLVSSFLLLLFCYLLWRIKEGRPVSAVGLACSFLSLFFTRAIFQGYWLLLLRYPRRRMMLFLALTALVTGSYTLKQMSLFGIPATTSFMGLNLCQSVNAADMRDYYDVEIAAVPDTLPARPRVLSRFRKIDGTVNFNHARYLEIDRRLRREYVQHLLSTPLPALARDMLKNLRIYLLPSSRYSPHAIVDRTPWRPFYDRLASFPVMPALLTLAALFWLLRAQKSSYHGALGLALLVVCVALICVLFERGENMRFKFFIEPILYCFLVAQGHGAGKELARRVRRGSRRR